jgi:hypothetical protein
MRIVNFCLLDYLWRIAYTWPTPQSTSTPQGAEGLWVISAYLRKAEEGSEEMERARAFVETDTFGPSIKVLQLYCCWWYLFERDFVYMCAPVVYICFGLHVTPG